MSTLTQPLQSDNRLLKLLDELAGSLDKEEMQMLLHLLQTNPGQEMDVLQDLMSYTYEHTPVPMRQFIEQPEYLGLKGQIYPVILNDLEELFDSKKYNEAVLTGGIGWGKSTFAELALIRMVYETSCLRNPQRMYGLSDGSIIAFVNVSINLTQARNVVFTGIKTKMVNSHYFKNVFNYDQSLKTEMRFPKGIWISPASSSEGGVIGLNVFGGVLDEVNFMAVIENSKQAVDGGTYDQATQLHNAMIRRMKSRFMVRGKLPGILLSISSSKYPDDFTERRIQEAIENEEDDVFIRRYEQWATKPKDRYSGEKFIVCLGDALTRAHIVDTDEKKAEDVQKNLKLIDVPIEYKRDFIKDIDMAIRDIAGRPTLSIKPFIRHKEKLYDAVNRGRELGMEHPFSREVTSLQDGGAIMLDLFSPMSLANKKKAHFCHGDLSLNGDGCGFAMGHVKGFKEVIRRNMETGEEYTIWAPEIVIDFMLRIVAPPNRDITLGDVRALIFELRAIGFNIRKVTFDQFQSADSIQQLERVGIESENLSIDSKLDPYNAFKDALYEDRLYWYEYLPALEEATRLEKNEKTNKVDHPASGSKDVTDAVAGVCFHCVTAPVSSSVSASYGELAEKKPAVEADKSSTYKFDPLDYHFKKIEEDDYYNGDDSVW